MAFTIYLSVVSPVTRTVNISCSDLDVMGFEIYYNEDGGAWNLWRTIGGGAWSWDDGPLTLNKRYGYYAHRIGQGDDSNEVYMTFFGDTITEALHLADSFTDAHAMGIIVIESLHFTDSLTDMAAFSDTITETLTLSDSNISSSTLKTDFAHYWGSEAGVVYITGPAIYSDDGAIITSYWKSKDTDFSDVYPELSNQRKTLYQVQVTYVDHYANTNMTVSVSNDSGSTWESKTKTVGTGSLEQKVAFFYFVMSGQVEQVKVQSSSTAHHFQITGIELFFLPNGENYGD